MPHRRAVGVRGRGDRATAGRRWLGPARRRHPRWWGHPAWGRPWRGRRARAARGRASCSESAGHLPPDTGGRPPPEVGLSPAAALPDTSRFRPSARCISIRLPILVKLSRSSLKSEVGARRETVAYSLGVALGTAVVAAATAQGPRVEMFTLGDRTVVTPAVVYAREDGTIVTGEAANRRAVSNPERVGREFKRRLGDPTPVMLGGGPH